MELFIRIKDGATVGNPIMGDNFREAFPDVDVDNLPLGFARFTRVERPVLGMYQVFAQEKPTYELVGGVWADVWLVRDMTAEEKSAKQQPIKDKWSALPNKENFLAWTFNEDLLVYEPPIPRPEPVEGKLVFWSGADANWKEAPARPEGEYKFDFFAWNWVAL